LGRLDRDAVDSLTARDPDPDAAARVVLVEAAQPDAAAKAAAWAAVLDGQGVPMGMLGEFQAAFWQPGQAEVLAPYVERYAAAMEELSKVGMLAALGRTAVLFPLIGIDETGLAQLLAAARQDGISAIVRSTVQEQADQLRRMLAARST
jgi:aminopeptidase N